MVLATVTTLISAYESKRLTLLALTEICRWITHEALGYASWPAKELHVLNFISNKCPQLINKPVKMGELVKKWAMIGFRVLLYESG